MAAPVVISKVTNIPETVQWIKKLALQGAYHPEVIKIADKVRSSPDPLKTLFDWAYNAILYVPDEPGKQQLKTVDRLLRDKKGNCVGYSTLISAVLLNLGWEHFYDVVSFDKPNVFNHIYVNTKSSILDPVPGHKQDGSDTWQNRPKEGKFNYEIPHCYKIKYYMPQLEILQGTKDVKPIYQSRSKRSRHKSIYGHLGCTESHLGCGTSCSSCNHNGLGKTLVGKFLTGVGDVLVGTANVLVTPIEGLIGSEIIGPNVYSDTGFGKFVEKSQEKNAALNQIIGNVVSTVFTGGALKIKNTDALARAQETKATQSIADLKYAGDTITANNKIAQDQFNALNNPKVTPVTDPEKTKKIVLTLMMVAAGGAIIYKNNR